MDEKEAEARPIMGTIFLVYLVHTTDIHHWLTRRMNWSKENDAPITDIMRPTLHTKKQNKKNEFCML